MAVPERMVLRERGVCVYGLQRGQVPHKRSWRDGCCIVYQRECRGCIICMGRHTLACAWMLKIWRRACLCYCAETCLSCVCLRVVCV